MCGAVCAADHVTAFRWGRLRQRVWELDFERLNGDGTAARKLPDPPCSLKRCGTQCMLSVVCRNSILIKGYESMRSEHAMASTGSDICVLVRRLAEHVCGQRLSVS